MASCKTTQNLVILLTLLKFWYIKDDSIKPNILYKSSIEKNVSSETTPFVKTRINHDKKIV